MTWKPIAEWASAGLVVGAVIGGGGVYWFTQAPPKIVRVVIPGPSRVVTRRIVVYRHNVLAAKRITCGARVVTVTARMHHVRSGVHGRKHFNERRIVLHITSSRPFLSLRQKWSALVGYGAFGNPQGADAGLSLGIRDRMARIGPVEVDGSVRSLGRGVLVLVDARVRL